MKLVFWLRGCAAIAFVCLGLAVPAVSQSTTVTTTYLGGSVSPTASGNIYWQPVQAINIVLGGARVGTTSGQIRGIPYVGSIANGVTSVALPDALLTNPNIGYAVTAIDGNGNVVLGNGLQADGVHVNLGGAYGLVQPTGTTWNFDTYIPGVIPTLLPATLFSAPITNTLSAGASATAAIALVGGQYQLTFGIPPGPPGTGSDSNCHADGSGHLSCLTVAAGAAVLGGVPVVGDTYYTGLNVYADSFGAGYGATVHTTYGYAYLLQNDFGGTFNNYAVSGSTAPQAAVAQMFTHSAPSYTRNQASVIQLGTNDAACGVTTGCENNYTHTMTALVAFRAIPREYQIQFGNSTAACTTTGTWIADNALSTGLGLQTIAPTSTITCTTLTSSPYLYLAWIAADAYTASASISLNSGAVTGTLNAFGYNSQSISGGSSVFANRYFISGGITTFTITVNTAGSSNPFRLVFAGGPMPTTSTAMANFTENPPRVFLLGVGYLPGFTTPDSSLAAYDTINSTLAAQFVADGAFVSFVNLRNPTNVTGLPNGPLNNSTDYAGATLPNGAVCPATADAYHPGNCGHQHIRDAVVAIARPVSSAPTGGIAASSLQLSNFLMSGTSSHVLASTEGVVQLNGSSSTLDMTATGFPSSYSVFLVNYGVGLPTLTNGPAPPAAGGGEVAFWNSAGWRIVATTPSAFSFPVRSYTVNHTFAATDVGINEIFGANLTLTLPALGALAPIIINNAGTTTQTLSYSGSTSIGLPTQVAVGQTVCVYSTSSNQYLPACAVPAASATLTTTAATTDNLAMPGLITGGHCSLAPTNASAATNVATTYISAKTTNQITVTHTATAGMTFDAVCTPN